VTDPDPARAGEDGVGVCYIAGAGRSGTTMLDVLLGELDGCFSAGEMRWLWWGLLNGWRCGCGAPLRDCELWSTILRHAYGDPTEAKIAELLRLQQTTIRLHYLPRLLARDRGRPLRWQQLERYADAARRLYRSIAQVTGARVVVDSSKNAPEAALLRLLPGIEPYMLQLTRDPRAVANSMKRKVKMEPMTTGTFEQPRHSSAGSALIWVRKNAAAHATRLRYGSERARLVRYEDVVATPRETLEAISALVRQPFSGLRFLGERTVELHGNHTAWGNPSRFKTGAVELRVDDEWMSRLGPLDRLVPTALSLPLLLGYGYPVRRSSARPGRRALAA
jgi:Sulfotransferase family